MSFFQTEMPNVDQRMKALPCSKNFKSFFHELLYFEEQFHGKDYGLTVINGLVKCYGCLVEFYDALKDPIKHYFLEKMQFVLSRPETLQKILPQDKKHNELNINFQDDSSEDSLQSSLKLGRYSISKKKQERATQIKIFFEVDQMQQEQQQNLQCLLKEYEDVSKDFSKAIDEQLKMQSDLLQQKLQKRGANRKRANSFTREEKKPIKVDEETQEEIQEPIQRSKKESLIDEIRETTRIMRNSISRMAVRKSINPQILMRRITSLTGQEIPSDQQ